MLQSTSCCCSKCLGTHEALTTAQKYTELSIFLSSANNGKIFKRTSERTQHLIAYNICSGWSVDCQHQIYSVAAYLALLLTLQNAAKVHLRTFEL